MFQTQRCLDQPSHTRRCVQMADIRFDRPDSAITLGFALTKCLAQGGEFDGVTQRGRSTVGLDIADILRLDSGGGLRDTDRLGLCRDRGRGVARLLRAVIVDAMTPNDGDDLVPVGLGILQTAQHDQPGPVAKNGARGLRIKGAAMPIGRGHAVGQIHIRPLCREGHRDAPGQHHVRAAHPQAIASLRHRQQRSRTSRLHIHRRPSQAQLVGHAGGQEILVVAKQLGKVLDRIAGGKAPGCAGFRQYVVQQIGVLGRPRENPDPAIEAFRIMPGIVQRGLRQFQQDPMLWVQRLGVMRRDTEMAGVEMIRILHDAPRGHIGAIGISLGGVGFKLFGGEMRNQLLTRDQFLPEAVDIPGTRETPGHADDGNQTRAHLPGGFPQAGRFAVGAVFQPLGQRGHAGLVEQGSNRKPPVQCCFQLIVQPRQMQRGRAQIEEIHLSVNLITIQNVLQIGCDQIAHAMATLTGRACPGRNRLQTRQQCPAVHLAVLVQWQLIDLFQPCRAGIVWQRFLQLGTNGLRVKRRPFGGHAKPDQRLVGFIRTGLSRHRSADNGWLRFQRNLDLIQLNPEATDFHLTVDATEETEDAIFVHFDQITGTIKTLPIIPRRGHEFFSRQVRPVPITQRQPAPADIKLSLLTRRAGLQVLVQGKQVGAPDGGADRNGLPTGQILIGDQMRADHITFGRAIAIDHPQTRTQPTHLGDMRGRDHVTADDQLTHIGKTVRSQISHRVKQPRGQPQSIHAMAFNRLGQIRDRQSPIGRNDHCTAVQQRREEIDDRGIKGKSRGMQRDGLRPQR